MCPGITQIWSMSMLKLARPAAIGILLTGLSVTPAADGRSSASASTKNPSGKSPRGDQARHMKPFWAKRLTGYLKTRDGEELHYSVLLPPGSGPFPTLVVYSGYSPGAIGGAAYLAGNVNYPRDIEEQLLD